MPRSIVATRGVLGGLVVSGNTQSLTSERVRIADDTSNVKIAFAGGRSGAFAANITVKASVSKNGGSPIQVTWSAATSVSIAPGAIATSDVVSGLTLVRGDYIDIKAYAVAASGADIWATQYLNGNFSDGIELGNSLTDKTMSGTITAAGAGASGVRGYTAAWVEGDTTTSNRALIIWGDSISIGTGDSSTQSGYLAIACERNLVPYVRGGAGGSTSGSGVSLLTSDAQVSALHTAFGNYVSFEYGVNDISSAASSTTLQANAQSFATQAKVLYPGAVLSVSTVLPVVNSSTNLPQNDGYWNPTTKETARVTYNNAVRANYLTWGYSRIWEAAGDASGVSGLALGAESAKDSGSYRADVAAAHGYTSMGDGLHPDRPLLTIAASAGINVSTFVGRTQVWGPELLYGDVDATGNFILLTFVPSQSPILPNQVSATGITATIGGTAYPASAIEVVNGYQVRLYPPVRIQSGQSVVVNLSSSNLADTIGNTALNTSLATGNFVNNSTYGGIGGEPDNVDTFTRADTTLNASTNNTTVGGTIANLIDIRGNGGNISSNKLIVKPGKIYKLDTATAVNMDAEIQFSPGDFTASDSVGFNLFIGGRYGATDVGGADGFYLVANRDSVYGAGRLNYNLNSGAGGNVFSGVLGGGSVVSGGWKNAKTYALRLTLQGTGSGKTARRRVYEINGSTRTLISDVVDSNYVNQPSGSGFTVFGLFTDYNADSTTDTEVKVDNFGVYSFDTTAPTVSLAEVPTNGKSVDLTFVETSGQVNPTATDLTGFVVKVNGSSVTVSKQSVFSGIRARLLLATAVLPGQTVTLDYAPGNVVDASSNALASFTGFSVTNNSTVGGGSLSAGSISVTGQTGTSLATSITAPSGGTSPYSYELHLSTTTGFTPNGGTLIASGSISSTITPTITGLTTGTTYYLKVKYFDSASGVVTSSQASGTPVYAALAAGTLTASNILSTSVQLLTTEPTGGLAPYGYQLHRSTTDGFTPGGGTVVSGATQRGFLDTGLTANTTYHYKEVYTDQLGGSVTSSQVTVTTLLAPPSVTGTFSAANTVSIAATSSGITQFDFELNGTVVTAQSSPKTYTINNAFSANKWRVRSRNGGGPGEWSPYYALGGSSGGAGAPGTTMLLASGEGYAVILSPNVVEIIGN